LAENTSDEAVENRFLSWRGCDRKCGCDHKCKEKLTAWHLKLAARARVDATQLDKRTVLQMHIDHLRPGYLVDAADRKQSRTIGPRIPNPLTSIQAFTGLDSSGRPVELSKRVDGICMFTYLFVHRISDGMRKGIRRTLKAVAEDGGGAPIDICPAHHHCLAWWLQHIQAT
jgi:hypothetical protein